MLRVKVTHNRPNSLERVMSVHERTIKSSHYYQDYQRWFHHTFTPSYLQGTSSILIAECKVYGTMIGFCLLKHNDDETKISNLSPLVDGVGLTQCLLDSSEFVLTQDYDIYIPSQAVDLISKVKALGFHHVEESLSKDQTLQHKFSKPRHLSWI